MRGVIIVETMEEYKKWLAEQKSEYSALFPATQSQQNVTDTAKKNILSQALPVKNN
jgi:heme/copper-type cytochrome/quinol oxidase subunit 2